MRKSLSIIILLAYTVIGPVAWLLAFIVTLPFVWKSVLTGKKLTPKRKAPSFVPLPKTPGVSGNPTTPGPVPKPGPVDIAAKIEAGTMTPEDWMYAAWLHRREHIC